MINPKTITILRKILTNWDPEILVLRSLRRSLQPYGISSRPLRCIPKINQIFWRQSEYNECVGAEELTHLVQWRFLRWIKSPDASQNKTSRKRYHADQAKLDLISSFRFGDGVGSVQVRSWASSASHSSFSLSLLLCFYCLLPFALWLGV